MEGAERVFLDWLVYALGQLVVVGVGLWDMRRRGVGVYHVGVLVWWAWFGGWLAWDVGEFGGKHGEVNLSDGPLSAG